MRGEGEGVGGLAKYWYSQATDNVRGGCKYSTVSEFVCSDYWGEVLE